MLHDFNLGVQFEIAIYVQKTMCYFSKYVRLGVTFTKIATLVRKESIAPAILSCIKI